MRRRKLLLVCVTALAVLALGSQRGRTQGATKTWTGGAGAWTDAGSWNPPGVPIDGDSIVIPSGTVTLPLRDVRTPVVVGNLTVTGGALDTTGSFLEVGGVAVVGPGGDLTGGGTVGILGTLTTDPASTLSMGLLSIEGGTATINGTIAQPIGDLNGIELGGGVLNLNQTTPISVPALILGAGTVNIKANITTTLVHGGLVWDGGRIVNTSLPRVPLTITTSSAEITNLGVPGIPFTPHLLDGVSLVNNLGPLGPSAWAGGTITLANGATITNMPNAILDIQAPDGGIAQGVGAAGAFINQGTISTSVAARNKNPNPNFTWTCTVPLTNTGSVAVGAGRVRLAANSTHTGVGVIDVNPVLVDPPQPNNPSLEFGPGIHNVALPVTATNSAGVGNSTVLFTGGNVTLKGAFAAPNQTTVNGGGVSFAGPTSTLGSLSATGNPTMSFAGAVTVGGGYTQAGGAATLARGTLNGNVTINAGSLTGEGTINGNLTNSGTVTVGTPTGLLNVTGTYTQGPNAVLAMGLGGTAPGASDQLLVTGKATLAGTLRVTTGNGYVPAAGDSLRVLGFASRAGAFTTVTGMDAGTNRLFRIADGPTGITFTTEDTAPDLVIKKATDPDTAFAGANTFQGATPAGTQIVGQTVKTGATRHDIAIQNPRGTARSFRVKADTATGGGWTIAYNKRGADGTLVNVTPQITTTGYTTASLAPGAKEVIEVSMRMAPSVGGNVAKSVNLTAFYDTVDITARDTVRATANTGNAPGTPDVLSPATEAFSSSLPEMRVKATDPEGDVVRLTVEVTTAGATKTYQSDAVASGSEVTVAVPANQALTAGNWSWRARAVDDNGIAGAFSAARTLRVPAAAALPGLARSAGLWLFGMGIEADGSPAAAFGLQGARVAAWDASAQRYVLDAAVSGIDDGTGYWVKNAAVLPLRFTGKPASGPVSLRLRPGWNLLSAPFMAAVRWDHQAIRVRQGASDRTLAEAATAGVISDYAVGWQPSAGNANTGSYSPVYDSAVIPGVPNTWEPWKAYWVRAAQVCDLVLPAPSQLTAASSRKAPAGTWSVRILGQSGAGSGAVMVGASAGRALEIAAPPALPESGGIQMSLAGNGGPLMAQTREAGGQKLTWDLVVGDSAGDVVLTWPDLRSLPKDLSLTLVDTATGQRRSMRTTASYTFRGGDERRFQVVAEKRSRLQLAITGLDVTRARGSSRAISFQLSADAAVNVEVLSPDGRTVATVARGRSLSAGLNTVAWTGEPAGGLYLILATATNEDGTSVRAIKPVVLTR